MRIHAIIGLLIGIYLSLPAHPGLGSHDIDHSYELIKSKLRDNEILIEILIPDESDIYPEYYALTVKSNYQNPHIIKLFSTCDLERELKKGFVTFSEPVLSEMLLTPLYNELSEVESVFFIPAGRFHSFPIEYCIAEKGVMLCEKYSFFRLSSSSILLRRYEPKIAYDSYAVFAGIDYDLFPDFEEKYEQMEIKKSSHGYLQDSYIAALDIDTTLTAAGLKGNLYFKGTATEPSFKTIPEQDIQLLLIETHSIAYHEPYTSPNALMMAGASYVMEGGIVPDGEDDGILTLQEIEELDLSNIDLAVISACSSAIDKNDGNVAGGLLKAFKTAGVNSLVMTTNDVVDYVSGEVWKRFFKNIVWGMTKRESLLDAVKEIKALNDGFYNSPEVWASYILIDGID
ncbi:MAG: CHAT domain-containing protein [Muribaculaceae bacterium]|nr:CHAT domain-containing protein [Muribaculaceae bacterium]